IPSPQSPVLLVRVPALVASGLTCSPFVTIRGRLYHFQELVGNKISLSCKSWMTTVASCRDTLP
ncbi:MAG: hypothetical protein V7L09_04050, partial [Nostoc sp.]|uniref:hypothetical protein n=1 Tax=Nostoc sp. TaxID=1180 RepID=UPI002FEE98B9